MTTRAKFAVSSITRTLGYKYIDGKSIEQEVQTIALRPCAATSEENKRFFASTPTGEIQLGIVNLEAARLFELNKEYYVDFTPAESPAV